MFHWPDTMCIWKFMISAEPVDPIHPQHPPWAAGSRLQLPGTSPLGEREESTCQKGRGGQDYLSMLILIAENQKISLK